ncbi:helix-turn-helix domain-containing protein [Paenibacillus radicis (ex Xue et al. 2023)]|uniref:Helix-turn-helix transcriptional regulator n=1 Tax=Paenibacillus radicis (ex Xue et al. 2023) TaxID=2972489 RepID=A0ABT1YIG0_9BACL|nr:helix-turn-helix transcriptional regulator [Paenibacillus radicis (ex Xue et al. 2023)]MCR8632525.1 helix-turn-helix transcriptional regulator [Paenibacillus radicis (ex Xue et al. 2023)]
MKFDDFMEEIGENSIEAETIRQIARMVADIVRRRKMLGLTQDQVAKKAGLSQAQVARLENSSQIPRVDTLIKVAIALGMYIHLNATEEEAATLNQVAHV